MTIRRLALYLVLVLLLLPGGALAGSHASAAPDGTRLVASDDAPPSAGDATTRGEAPSPVLERGAPPRYESGRLAGGAAAGMADGRPLVGVPAPRPERFREPAAASVRTPLYLSHCSFLC